MSETPNKQPAMLVQKIALGVALGVLAAVAVVFVVYQASQPSELECLIQETDVASGHIEPYEMDDDCR